MKKFNLSLLKASCEENFAGEHTYIDGNTCGSYIFTNVVATQTISYNGVELGSAQWQNGDDYINMDYNQPSNRLSIEYEHTDDIIKNIVNFNDLCDDAQQELIDELSELLTCEITLKNIEQIADFILDDENRPSNYSNDTSDYILTVECGTWVKDEDAPYPFCNEKYFSAQETYEVETWRELYDLYQEYGYRCVYIIDVTAKMSVAA